MSRKPTVTVPYASAKSDGKARDEISKILQRFGCEHVGFADNFAKHEVILAFQHRGRPVQLKASARGWAAMFLRAKPWTSRARCNRMTYEGRALEQGLVAVNSMLRDWVKGQVTAVECGMLSFEAVFMPHMLTPDGRSVLECVQSSQLLLPAA